MFLILQQALETSGHGLVSTSMVCCSSPSKRASWSKLASCSTHMTWKSGEYAVLRGTPAACTTCMKGRSALSRAPRTTVLARDSSSRKPGEPARQPKLVSLCWHLLQVIPLLEVIMAQGCQVCHCIGPDMHSHQVKKPCHRVWWLGYLTNP